MRRQDAFSLVELLVLILIIGILATVAIPRFIGQRDSAHNAEATAALETAVKAAYSWQIEHNTDLWATDDGVFFTRLALKEYEPGLYAETPCEPQEIDASGGCTNGGCVPSPAMTDRPGPQADPTAIYVGRSGTCNNPSARPVMVLCSVSRGDSIFCAALDLTAGVTRWRRYQTSNPLPALGDGVTAQRPTYNTGGLYDIDQTEL